MTKINRGLGYSAVVAAALIVASCSSASQSPPVQSTAAPQPVVAPTQRQFNVYFDFDKFGLTPEAREVVARVITEANRDLTVKIIMLVGKTDTAGTDRYNINLSHRRADSVRGALTQGGIAPDRIQEKWVGYHEPPIPTAPGVREPRNRVVEITFQ